MNTPIHFVTLFQVNYSKELDGSISSYGRLAQGSFEVQKNFPGRVHDVASIDVMMETRKTLVKMEHGHCSCSSQCSRKKTRGLTVLLGVSGEPRPRPNCG